MKQFVIEREDGEFLTATGVEPGQWAWVKNPQFGWMDAYVFTEIEEEQARKFCERNPGARIVWVP